MEKLLVKELAGLAGVSVRTLHHYDQIGLLKPMERSESGYRYYGQAELLKLQQIMLYREMGVQLSQISEIINNQNFDVLDALHKHKKELQKKRSDIETLLQTVSKTINHLKNKKKMKNNELYAGFNKEQASSYRREASERWGKEIVDESHQRLEELDASEWKALQALGERLNQQLAEKTELDPGNKTVQKLIAQHFEMTGKYFAVTPEIYRNLGEMYVSDERFRSYYDKYKPGLAAFICNAIKIYTAEK